MDLRWRYHTVMITMESSFRRGFLSVTSDHSPGRHFRSPRRPQEIFKRLLRYGNTSMSTTPSKAGTQVLWVIIKFLDNMTLSKQAVALRPTLTLRWLLTTRKVNKLQSPNKPSKLVIPRFCLSRIHSLKYNWLMVWATSMKLNSTAVERNLP